MPKLSGKGVIIRFSPEYYVKELDSTIANSIRNHDEKGLTYSVGIMLHTIAAMDGDWDNGENKLEHAKKLLGPAVFEEFKNTFPQKYAKLLEERKVGTGPLEASRLFRKPSNLTTTRQVSVTCQRPS